MSRTVQTELTNMCMIYDGSKILVQEKILKDRSGIIFPGGHIEAGESITASVVREMKEETGLVIRNPQLCGVKDWIEDDGTRYIVFLYKTDQFSGELSSSEEGRVFWIERADLEQMNLIWNLKELMPIFETDKFGEFFFVTENDQWEGKLIES